MPLVGPIFSRRCGCPAASRLLSYSNQPTRPYSPPKSWDKSIPLSKHMFRHSNKTPSTRFYKVMQRSSSTMHPIVDDHPREACGVWGIYAPGREVARLTFFGLFALQ